MESKDGIQRWFGHLLRMVPEKQQTTLIKAVLTRVILNKIGLMLHIAHHGE